MIRRWCAALALAAALGAPHDALATSSPPVSVQIVGTTGPAVPGQPYTADLLLTASATMTLSQFSITPTDSNGTLTHNAPQLPVLLSGRSNTRTIRVTLTPATASPGIRIRFRANSTVVSRSFDFSSENWQRVTAPTPSSLVPASVVILEPPASEPPSALLTPVEREARVGEGKLKRKALPGESKSAGGGNIVVRGRFVYLRDDGSTWPVDNATVRVYDEDWDWDEHLGTSITGVDGRFELTVFASESEPDLYLEFELANSRVVVEYGWLENNYLFTTGVKEDFTGSTADFGTRQPNSEQGRAACHIFTNLTRGWREMNRIGRDVPSVDAIYPSGDWPHYDGEINIPENVAGERFGWNGGTHLHEYGHHIQWSLFYVPDFDYDNGICNNPNGDPGHCAWCEEDDGTALNEGFANWVSDILHRRHVQFYGHGVRRGRSVEALGSCGEGAIYGDEPYIIEGNFSALLRDLEDSENEDDPARGVGVDQLTIDPAEILGTMGAGSHEGPAGFINKFLQRNSGIPASWLWNTFINAGYQLDAAPPGVSPYFESTSHNEGLQYPESPDRTIDMTWQPAPDDYSGAVAYSLRIGTSALMPGTTASVTEGQPLAGTVQAPGPGTYYVTLRARDANGTWSNNFATAGPYRIRDPYPADLAAPSPLPAGWDAAVSMRSNNLATVSSASATSTLNSGGNSYWNAVVHNFGEVGTLGTRARLLIDGVQRDSATVSATAGGARSYVLNDGPVVVGGGRHTVEVWYDAAETEAESNEDNNRRSRQLVWDPDRLDPFTFYSNPSPPRSDAGHDALPAGILPSKNCDGFEISHVYTPPGGTFSANAVWSGAYAHATSTSPLQDVDLRVFASSTSSTNGYVFPRSVSTRGTGLLDAVFTNRIPNGDGTWDLGVYRDGWFATPYRLRQLIPSSLQAGDSVTVSFAQDEMMRIFTFTVLAGQTGWYSIDVSGAPALVNNVTTLWFDQAKETAGIEDFDRKTTSNLYGRSSLQVSAFSTGTYLIAVHRNPSTTQGPMSFGLRLRLSQPDGQPFTANGWAAPLVPRRTPDGAPGPAQPTAWLDGDLTTWMNVCVRNNGSVLAPQLETDILWDGVRVTGPTFIEFNGNATRTAYDVSPTTIPGGRHTLWLQTDPDDDIVESDELDNTSGRQWSFIPPVRPLDTPRWRKHGRRADAGWSTLPDGEVVYLNQDGIRTPAFTSGMGHQWAGVALTPLGASDMDLWLHEKAATATDGFSSPLTSSDWGAGLLDYVLVDFSSTAHRGFDAGLVRADVAGVSDTAQYVTEVLGSQSVPNPSAGIGPVTLGYGQLMDLYSLPLTYGRWNLRVLNGSGSTVDWGIALHVPGTPFQSRSDATSRADWLGGNGAAENISVIVDRPGDYGLVIFKAGSGDIAKSGSYTVQITMSTLGADAEPLPVATGLRSAAPDPFEHEVRFGLDLAEGSDVRLDIHDVTGARRRVLAEGPWAAGRHSLVWDGRDDDGRAVPPGLYWVRMNAGGQVSSRKVVRTR